MEDGGKSGHSFTVEVTVRSGIPPAPAMTTTVGLNNTDEKGYLPLRNTLKLSMAHFLHGQTGIWREDSRLVEPGRL